MDIGKVITAIEEPERSEPIQIPEPQEEPASVPEKEEAEVEA